MRSPAGFLRICLAACTVCLTACASDPSQGYAMTSPFDTSIETIAVPVFDNDTFQHGLEITLTDAIVKEIHRSTPWRVVSPDRAQTTLTGAITSAQMRFFSRNTDSGIVQEMALDVAVSFEWKSNKDAKVLLARHNFHVAEPFVPAYAAQERLEQSRRTSSDQLARDLVSELRSSW